MCLVYAVIAQFICLHPAPPLLDGEHKELELRKNYAGLVLRPSLAQKGSMSNLSGETES